MSVLQTADFSSVCFLFVTVDIDPLTYVKIKANLKRGWVGGGGGGCWGRWDGCRWGGGGDGKVGMGCVRDVLNPGTG